MNTNFWSKNKKIVAKIIGYYNLELAHYLKQSSNQLMKLFMNSIFFK
jgi:hypothetical protein